MIYRLLRIIPKNLLSHGFGAVANCRFPFGLHTTLKNWFVKRYGVDCSEMEYPLESYETLGRLFIRKLKLGSRPIAENILIAPVDGVLTQAGKFPDNGAVLTQIKDKTYTLDSLVAADWDMSEYRQGGYLTIYLAPYNYHRIHSSMDGEVLRVAHIPGALWPVNGWSVRNIDGLFAANERVVVEMASSLGKMLVIMVGATNVGRITLDFNSEIIGNSLLASQQKTEIITWAPDSPIFLNKGDGLGCFELGSTVILILSPGLFQKIDSKFLCGENINIRVGEGLSH